jgi:GR25 family glycosyltransferase involved in LPS biosynthesis
MKLAPIVIFGYNRPSHLRRCLESLQQNALAKDSQLTIYLDGPKPGASAETLENIAHTAAVARAAQWCGEVTVVQRPHNLGLAVSIEQGVTAACHAHGRVIVLEDDLVLAPHFLQFMNDALALYADEPQVMHISGYIFPHKEKLPDTFFFNSATCWGWATWQRAWQHYNPDAQQLKDELHRSGLWSYFDLEDSTVYAPQLEGNISGKLHTWAVKWHASIILKRGLCLHPNASQTANTGLDSTGAHCQAFDAFRHARLNATPVDVRPLPLIEHAQARAMVKQFYKNSWKPVLSARIKSKIRQVLGMS